MSFQHKENRQAALNHLWGSFVPPLTPEQIDLSVELWQKIKARKQREQKLGLLCRSRDVLPQK